MRRLPALRVSRIAVLAFVVVSAAALAPRVVHAAPWAHGDPNAVVKTILAQPAYRQAPASTAPAFSLIDAIVKWIGDLFHRLFGNVKIAPGATKVLSFGALLLLLAALGWLGYLAFRFIVAFVRNSPTAGSRVRQEGLEQAQSAADLQARARRAAARGDYALAIALLFRAALTALDERSLIAYDAARTPGEYRRIVRRTVASAAAPFDDLTACFVRASFAATPPGSGDYERAAVAFGAFAPLASAA